MNKYPKDWLEMTPTTNILTEIIQNHRNQEEALRLLLDIALGNGKPPEWMKPKDM
jgi:hypothetical protein